MQFDMSVSDIVTHQKSKNVIYCGTDLVIRIGDIAANIITSEFINHVLELRAPDYKLCTLHIDGHDIDACYTNDVYSNAISLQFLTNLVPNNLQDIAEYVDVISGLAKEYFDADITSMMVHRTQLAFLLSSVIMPIDNIILCKHGDMYMDDGVVFGVSFGYNLTENSNRNFLANHSGKDELLQYFSDKPMLNIDYTGFKKHVREKLNCNLYNNNNTFRLRCEYILRIIDMLMKRTEGVIWLAPSSC